MSSTIFSPGASVVTPIGSGTIIDVRATASGAFVFGVEDADGVVTHVTEKAIRLEQG